MLSNARVNVTMHALIRWRERAAEYGNAKADDVIAAVRAARIVTVAELPPTPHRWRCPPGTTYAVSGSVVFVLKAVERSRFDLITVVVPPPMPESVAVVSAPVKPPKCRTCHRLAQRSRHTPTCQCQCHAEGR